MKRVTISYGLVALMILLGAIVGNLITTKASHLNTNLNKEYFEPIEIGAEYKQHYLENTRLDSIKHFLIENQFIVKTYRAEKGWVTVAKRINPSPRIETTLEIHHLSLTKDISNITVTIDGSRYYVPNYNMLVINNTANSCFSEIAQITNQTNQDEAVIWICDNVAKATTEAAFENNFGTVNYRLSGTEFKRYFQINPSI